EEIKFPTKCKWFYRLDYIGFNDFLLIDYILWLFILFYLHYFSSTLTMIGSDFTLPIRND
ncbi:hypothetical protein DY566_23605, partial [Salmonella enterica]|nr:hypothetical protein [Salmonella enterica]